MLLPPFSQIDDASGIEIMPVGDYSLELLDAQGELIEEIPFKPFDFTDGGGADDGTNQGVDSFFQFPIPFDDQIRGVRILKNGELLASRSASKTAPTVEMVFPNGGEVLDGDVVTITWRGKDTNRRSSLAYTVLYSPDGGGSWQALALLYRGNSIAVKLDELEESDSALIRVIVTDGFLTGTDVTDAVFTVPNSKPLVNILTPLSGEIYGDEQLIIYKAFSKDREDGPLPGSGMVWSSSIDGPLGTGRDLSVFASALTPGDHVFTLTGTDSSGALATDTVEIKVVGAEYTQLFIAQLDLDPQVLWPPNHKMVPVTVAVDLRTHPELIDPSCEIKSVESNQPQDDKGDGKTADDWVITGPLTVELRAERSGGRADRQYSLTVECSGTDTDTETVHTTTAVGVVTVPNVSPS